MSDHVEKFVRTAVQSFVGDPPDSDFQCGYLGAMLAVANYALGLPMETSPYAEAQKLWNDYEFDRPRCDEDATSKGGSRSGTEKKLRNLKPFKPGQSGNPKGRPKGARNRLGTQFLEALEADFNQFGIQAIALVREKKPEVYMRVVADLLPKEANINVEAGEAFMNLWRRISEGFGDELATQLDEEPPEGVH